MDELKPCPNCGGQAKVHKKCNKFYVECDGDCWTQTRKYSYKEDAVKEWNGLERRKEENALLPCPFCGGTKLSVGTIAECEMQDETHPDYQNNSKLYTVCCDYQECGCGESIGGVCHSE